MNALYQNGLRSLEDGADHKDIKSFKRQPPDGLKLYVKYRYGDIHEGYGTPLGDPAKVIEGTIVDSIIYKDDEKMPYMILIRVTESPDKKDIEKKIAIYPTRDIISLDPFPVQNGLTGGGKKTKKRVHKKKGKSKKPKKHNKSKKKSNTKKVKKVRKH